MDILIKMFFSNLLRSIWIAFAAHLVVCTNESALALLKGKHGSQVIQTPESVEIVFATICRDEAVNFRSNLELWTSTIKYYIFIMDDRNTDDSVDVIRDVLENKALGYKIIPHKFEGFGKARTTSLIAAWEHFPHASHVLIADPDWRPDPATLLKDSLVFDVDVFRFVILDRNGHTYRNADWLLRNKPGLKMKYAIHEVLDIGSSYSHLSIGWTVEEIEKPGTWHTTGGHGNSVSLKRLEYDLDLLSRDYREYGPLNPHVNYYLAVTHNTYVDKLHQFIINSTSNRYLPDSAVTAQIEYHRAMALGNASLRSIAYYDDEFTEQRWGAMFVAGCAYGDHSSSIYDVAKSESWYLHCRDFSPGQNECLRALVHLMYETKDYNAALLAVENVLRVKTVLRVGQNNRFDEDCTVPNLAAFIMSERLVAEMHAATMNSLPLTGRSNRAKYILHLVAMSNRPVCGQFISNTRGAPLKYSRQDLFEQAVNVSLSADSETIPVNESALCGDLKFQRYIISSKFQIYDCPQLKAIIGSERQCIDFITNIPSPSEDLQIKVFGEYIGAASLLDIAHNVYMGFFPRGTETSHFRVLFAEYFNPRMVYNLIGSAVRRLNGRVNITIVRINAVDIELMKDTIKACGAAADFSHITFVHGTLQGHFGNSSNLDQIFDYIEYNGGINLSPSYTSDLEILKNVLTTDGSIGLSYFTSNIHQATLDRLLRSRNTTQSVPLAGRPEYLLSTYFDRHGLQLLKTDPALYEFFSGKLNRPLSDSKPDTTALNNHRVFTKSEIALVLGNMGLNISAWIPPAYSNPFAELEHYEVQRFRSAGIPQDAYVEDIFPMFRYTLYVTKQEAGLPGRATMQRVLDHNLTLDQVIVVDRFETLSSAMGDAQARATNGVMSPIQFSYYAMPESTPLVYRIDPIITPGCALLSTSATIGTILQNNTIFWEQYAALHSLNDTPALSPRIRSSMMFNLLGFLERVNAVSFVYVGNPADIFLPKVAAASCLSKDECDATSASSGSAL